jgi:hypothetical protein
VAGGVKVITWIYFSMGVGILILSSMLLKPSKNWKELSLAYLASIGFILAAAVLVLAGVK